MKKIAYVFLSLCFLPMVAFCGVGGKQDTRKVIGWLGDNKPSYVDTGIKNIWNTPPYNNIVQINMGAATGTGSFISPRHILTNTHVAEGCGTGITPECVIKLSDGSEFGARVVAYGGINSLDDNITKDWSVLEISDNNFCSGHYFKHKASTTSGASLWRAGFGALRVLSDQDIQFIKKVYTDALTYIHKKNLDGQITMYPWLSSKELAKIYASVDAEKEININENNKFLGQSILVWFDAAYIIATKSPQNPTGRRFTRDYMNDKDTLKIVEDCSIKFLGGSTALHNCQSWSGDSGSSILDKQNQIVLLHRGGEKNITSEKTYINVGHVVESIFTENVLKILDAAEQKCKTSSSSMSKPVVTTGNNTRNIGDACIKSDLPSHATVGHYVNSGLNKYSCANGEKCSCAATQCESGYYLVVNASGNSQGWCYTSRCPSGKRLNIIDGVKTDTKCIDN